MHQERLKLLPLAAKGAEMTSRWEVEGSVRRLDLFLKTLVVLREAHICNLPALQTMFLL